MQSNSAWCTLQVGAAGAGAVGAAGEDVGAGEDVRHVSFLAACSLGPCLAAAQACGQGGSIRQQLRPALLRQHAPGHPCMNVHLERCSL